MSIISRSTCSGLIILNYYTFFKKTSSSALQARSLQKLAIGIGIADTRHGSGDETLQLPCTLVSAEYLGTQ
eukprot:SAG31_NODE_23876_length_493_cov_1.505076_1_plen_70_part_10